MAYGPALSTAGDSFSLLDVLHADQFEGDNFDPKVLERTEENFYRGAPPTWLNFHISEQAESDSARTPLIKRDGYDTLVDQIRQRRKGPGISTVKLFHHPGCGGTTLAMQVLWDLRKTCRSAVLTGSISDINDVANEVVHLFTAGDRGLQKTVLLLVNDERVLENLQDSIIMKIAEQKVKTSMPVVILLSCVRKDAVPQSDHVVLKSALSDTEQQKCNEKEKQQSNKKYVILKKELSETEKQKFNEKKEDLRKRYKDKCKQFHGFNIIQSNFSQAYIQEACAVFKTIKKINKAKTKLVVSLSLLNAYVPGSYLLESQCLDFLNCIDPSHEDLSLEDRMKPFSELIITFQQDMRSGKKVCMAHPLIAKCCTNLMAEAGVTRSDTAKNILRYLCRDEVPPFLFGFVKDMLTKREPGNKDAEKGENKKEMFSRLILDIQDIEKKPDQCAKVLEVAAKKFDQDPFFPQALARFYYIELKDYNLAEMWAKRAKERAPQSSFVADTLGQVHKKHLKIKRFSAKPKEVLRLAKKAIEAFKHEEQLAENELGADIKGNGDMKFSNFFNTAGQFGYLEVCNLVYPQLGDNRTLKDLISRDEVERKCAFLEKYLTYSKPNMKKDDPPYIYISECYWMYVGGSPSKDFRQKGTDFIQGLKEKLVDTSTGLPSFLDREYTRSELKQIATWWEEIFLRSSSKSSTVDNFNLRQKMPLSSKDAPELHLVTLLLSWPTDNEDTCVLDLSELVQGMHRSYEHTYKTYFRSRYLRPLFFIGKGRDLNRIVPREVLERLFLEQETTEDWPNKWSKEKIFEDQVVQEHLLKVQGVVRDYRVYATIGDKEIEVDANLQNSLWIRGQVSFYLGFTIRGPVAFGIRAKPPKKVSEVDIPKPEQMKPALSARPDTTRGQYFVDRHQTALINSVSDTGFILHKLEDNGLISKKHCDSVRALQTTQDQMRGILKFADTRVKNALYEILTRMKSMRPLLRELEESG